MRMSKSIHTGKVHAAAFHWGKKREQRVTTKEVHYESFTYDGIEYFLYDCVYLSKEGEPEPYIGKLIRIWENPNKGRRVLVLWFFRPSDISNYLGCQNVLENELFLASGNGVGLANENPLEAIGGKCNVVCISKDERNRRPSDEEVKMADYIFYRTFDVGSFTISDKLGEKIASIEVGFLLNKKEIRLSDLGTNSNAYSDNAVRGIQKSLLSILDTSEAETITPDANRISPLVEDDKGADMLDKLKSIEQHGDAEPNDTCPAALAATELASISNQKTRLKSLDCDQTYVDNVAKSRANDGIIGIRGFGKSKVPDSVNMLYEKANKDCAKNDGVDADTNDIKHSVLSTSSADKEKLEFGKDLESIGGTVSGQRRRLRSPYSNQIFLDNAAKSTANVQVTGNKGFNKFKCGDSVKMSNEKAKNNLGEKAVVDSNTNCMKDSGTSACSVEKGKPKFAKDFDRPVDTMRNMNPHCDASEGNLSKKLKRDYTAAPSCNNGVNGSRKPDSASIVREMGSRAAAGCKAGTSIMGEKASRPPAAVKAGTNGQAKLAIESNRPYKKLESKGVMDKSNRKSVNASLRKSKDVKIDANGQVNEGSRRSPEKSNWFKPVPWEERMKDSQVDGTLILLQNLDPAYTSSEVEEMISRAFGEGCTAKMVQHTSMFSPHSGQALVAFKTQGTAERVIKNLEQRCLMLPNGRPVVGSFWVTSLDEKQSQFPGHLVIDKLRRQTQRESKAVSTSHSSQANTLEYEMAVEWRLLQDRADFCWKKLNEQHEEDLKELVSTLKRKKQNAVE